MITIEQLKDWSNENARKNLEEKIEEYIDNKIQKEVLEGYKTICISTGSHNINGHYKSKFYELWCNEELSKVSLEVVRSNIIDKYRKVGLEVKRTRFDEGWNSSYEGLKITVPKHLLEDE